MYVLLRNKKINFELYLYLGGLAFLMLYTIKPVLSGHSKIDKTKVLVGNSSIMEVESIVECSPWNTFDLDQVVIGIENQFLVFF